MAQYEYVIRTLPWPPSVNHYWLRTIHGGMRISDRGKAFRRQVADAIHATMPFGTDPVCINLELFPPDRRRRDIDNILKALFDALEHANVYANDSQICELHMMRHPKQDKVGVDVSLSKARLK